MNAPSAESIDPRHDPWLVVEALCCVRDDRILFDAIDFGLHPGRIVQLEGANGSGKTTLLRAICGLAPIERGQVSWCGRPRDEVLDEFLAALTWVGHVPAVKRDLTPRENLAAASALTATGPALPADAAFERVGLDGLADTPLRRLSAGQIRRAALARLLAAPTRLWLLDEPLTALDTDGKRMLERLIADHAIGGGMTVLSTHQPLDLADDRVQRIRLGD